LPFPGIPEDALASLEEPNPIDLGLLRDAVQAVADPPDGPLSVLVEYGRLLLAANTVTNLTGARDWQKLIESHLTDCVFAAAHVPEDVRIVVDWGSGAGLPGLVWAALFPEKELWLCERNGKKAAFLEEAALRLELLNVRVFGGQAEERLAAEEERPDLIVARAVEPLPRLLGRIRRNRVRYRALMLMAGPRFEQDWEELGDEGRRSWKLAAQHKYALGEHGERRIVVLRPH
jgi:16S rRNA (guanine(527)-N(7))-methyltransferase RsmG